MAKVLKQGTGAADFKLEVIKVEDLPADVARKSQDEAISGDWQFNGNITIHSGSAINPPELAFEGENVSGDDAFGYLIASVSAGKDPYEWYLPPHTGTILVNDEDFAVISGDWSFEGPVSFDQRPTILDGADYVSILPISTINSSLQILEVGSSRTLRVNLSHDFDWTGAHSFQGVADTTFSPGATFGSGFTANDLIVRGALTDGPPVNQIQPLIAASTATGGQGNGDIVIVPRSNTSNRALRVFTSSDGVNMLETLTVRNGLVGIGQSGPAYALDIEGGGGMRIRDAGVLNARYRLFNTNATREWVIQHYDDSRLAITASGSGSVEFMLHDGGGFDFRDSTNSIAFDMDASGNCTFANPVAFTGKSGTLDYDEDTVEVGGPGSDFNAGEEIKCTKVGSQVVISTLGSLAHSSGIEAESAAGAIPSQYRPAHNQFVRHGSMTVEVRTDGTFWVGYPGAETSMNNAASISFNV